MSSFREIVPAIWRLPSGIVEWELNPNQETLFTVCRSGPPQQNPPENSRRVDLANQLPDPKSCRVGPWPIHRRLLQYTSAIFRSGIQIGLLHSRPRWPSQSESLSTKSAQVHSIRTRTERYLPSGKVSYSPIPGQFSRWFKLHSAPIDTSRAWPRCRSARGGGRQGLCQQGHRQAARGRGAIPVIPPYRTRPMKRKSRLASQQRHTRAAPEPNRPSAS